LVTLAEDTLAEAPRRKSMKPENFDYDRYHRKCEEVNRKAKQFTEGDFLPVVQWTLGEGVYGSQCRDRKVILPSMLDGITKTLEVENDWYPYLEPWHGIGVFAQAFGCPFEWNEMDAPWTRPIISDIDQLRRLEKPDIEKSEMLQYVLATTEYFNDQTRGEIAIAATDTQGPLSNLSLICDVTWMLTNAWDYPDEFHRVLGLVTDLIIEFTLEQRKRCTKIAAPGHTMWSPDIFKGISLSDDMLALVGTDFYQEFGLPYDRKIAEALDGVGVHSCGKWAHNFKIVQKLEKMVMIDLAISKVWDPDPNLPEKIVQAFSAKSIPVQVRCDPNDVKPIDTLLASDVKTILSFWWDEDPFKRQQSYHNVKMRWEAWRSIV
jgi:hypothetical protein